MTSFSPGVTPAPLPTHGQWPHAASGRRKTDGDNDAAYIPADRISSWFPQYAPAAWASYAYRTCGSPGPPR